MNLNYAGFWVRSMACSVDGLIVTLLSGILQVLLMAGIYVQRGMSGGWETLPPFWYFFLFDVFWAQVLCFIFYLIISTIYYARFAVKTQSAPGKKLFKLKIVSLDGNPVTYRQGVIRHLASIVSALPFGAGYVMVIFHPEKAALHDIIAGTRIVAEAAPSNATT